MKKLFYILSLFLLLLSDTYGKKDFYYSFVDDDLNQISRDQKKQVVGGSNRLKTIKRYIKEGQLNVALKQIELFKNSKEGKQHYSTWIDMLYKGEILQILNEMKESRDTKVSNKDSAQKEINYFKNNKWRMQYDLYRAKGYPIGSGLVEGNCKLVVGKRFKGNGMRWKKKDNEAVLDVRLAVLNNTLDRYFTPKPREFRLVS